jgi:hypothetical protein
VGDLFDLLPEQATINLDGVQWDLQVLGRVWVKELGRRGFDDSTIAKLEQAQVIFPRHPLLLNFLFKFLFENLSRPASEGEGGREGEGVKERGWGWEREEREEREQRERERESSAALTRNKNSWRLPSRLRRRFKKRRTETLASANFWSVIPTLESQIPAAPIGFNSSVFPSR